MSEFSAGRNSACVRNEPTMTVPSKYSGCDAGRAAGVPLGRSCLGRYRAEIPPKKGAHRKNFLLRVPEGVAEIWFLRSGNVARTWARRISICVTIINAVQGLEFAAP